MAYAVQIARPALRQFRGLLREIQDRIHPHVGALGDDPRPPGSRKLVGQRDYRIRVGDYRVVYDIDDANAVVTVTAILHRRDVYRRS